MDYDSYLMKFYGFDTQSKKYRRMTLKAKRILRQSFAADTLKESDAKKLATLYPSSNQSN